MLQKLFRGLGIWWTFCSYFCFSIPLHWMDSGDVYRALDEELKRIALCSGFLDLLSSCRGGKMARGENSLNIHNRSLFSRKLPKICCLLQSPLQILVCLYAKLFISVWNFLFQPIPVVSSSRWLLRRGELACLEGEKKMRAFKSLLRGGKYYRIYLFLFNDLLLVTKMKR